MFLNLLVAFGSRAGDVSGDVFADIIVASARGGTLLLAGVNTYTGLTF